MNEYIQKIDYILAELREAYINYHKNPDNEENSKVFNAAKNKMEEIYTRIINAQASLNTQRIEKQIKATSDEISMVTSVKSDTGTEIRSELAAMQINDMTLLYKNQLISDVGITIGCILITLLGYNIYTKVSQ